jgi:prolipoprotein diacylglyceryltransferase
VLRFLTDFLRAYDETLFGLTGAQYMCLVLIPFGIWLLADSRRDRPAPGAGDAVDPSGDAGAAGEIGGAAPA